MLPSLDCLPVWLQEVEECPEAQRLRTRPGVGSLTALAFVLNTDVEKLLRPKFTRMKLRHR